MTQTLPAQTMTIINHPDEIPAFATEAEEANFWDTHALGEAMYERAAHNPETQALLDLLPPKRPRPAKKSNPTSLRLSADLERRLRHLAALKGTSYQTLMKEFVLERVYEEEKRLGVV